MIKISKICNCGRVGHKIFECTLPSISIGIILYRINNGVRQYLMIRRNSSFGFLDLLKKNKYELDILKDIVDELTNDEKKVIYNKYIN